MCISRTVTKVVHEEQDLIHLEQLSYTRHLEEPPSIYIISNMEKITTRKKNTGYMIKASAKVLTGEMDFGRMDSQTRPARISVTESARVSMSALDCEL